MNATSSRFPGCSCLAKAALLCRAAFRGLAGIIIAAAAALAPANATTYTEDFESHANGTVITAIGGGGVWTHGTMTVIDGGGVAGSKGIGSSSSVFNWNARAFTWSDLIVGTKVVVSMDFLSTAGAQFDDDRVGWTITPATNASSASQFCLQIDNVSDGGMVCYWDSNRTILNPLSGVKANTWYRFQVEYTKLGATNCSVTGTLTELDGSGNPTGTPYVGTIADSSLAPYSVPASRFTASTMCPSFKNHTSAPANADNASFSIILPGPQAPTVAITSPADGATVPADFTIEATAADVDGTVVEVAFYEGENLLGTDTSAPYSYEWTGAPEGEYELTAVAKDNDDQTTVSEVVNITVSHGNLPPTVAITSPANGAQVGPNFTITASASDPDGSVVSVSFYDGATLLGTDTTSPYSYQWTGAPGGSRTLTAVAEDDDGATGTSAAVTVTVNPHVNVGMSGSGTLTFDTKPHANQWSTFSIGGAANSPSSDATMDTAVNAVAASSITNTLLTQNGGSNALGYWRSDTLKLGSIPTGNAATLIMSTLQNTSGSTINGLDVSFELGATNSPSEQINGYRVYWSKTGAAGTWTPVGTYGRTSSGTNTVQFEVIIPDGWLNGDLFYFVWADDNADGGTEGGYTIDNVVFAPVRPLANMLSFGVPGFTGTITATEDPLVGAVSLMIPEGTDITALVPTYTLSDGATGDPASGVAQDFTNPVTYTVTSADDEVNPVIVKEYVVTVTLYTPPVESTVIWNLTGAGDWDTFAYNWLGQGSGLPVPFSNGQNVIFNKSEGGVVSVEPEMAPASVSVSATAGSYTLAGGSIVGTSTLAKSGGGVLTLSGANTYSGGSTISAGTVQVGADGTGTAGDITSGPLGLGTLVMNGGVVSSDSTTARTILNPVSVTANSSFGAATNNGTLTFADAVTLTATRTLTVNSTVNVEGPLSAGSFTLTKAGPGTLNLNGESSVGTLTVGYAGGASSNFNYGTVAVGSDASLSVGSGSSNNIYVGVGTGSNNANGPIGRLDVSASSNFEANVGIFRVGGTVGGNGTLNLGVDNEITAATDFGVNFGQWGFPNGYGLVTTAASGTTTLNTPIIRVGHTTPNGTTGGYGEFILGDGATLNVAGIGVGGRTTLEVGIHASNNGGSHGTSFINLSGGGTGVANLKLSSIRLGDLQAGNSQGVTGNLILSANELNQLDVSGNSGALAVVQVARSRAGATASATLTIGHLGSNSSIVSQDNGTAILLARKDSTGASNGTLNLNAGTLTITTTGAAIAGGGGTGRLYLGETSNVTLRAGASSADWISGLTTAEIKSSGATIDTNGNNIGIPQTFTGAGGLAKSGAGTLTLGGANTYSGATTVNAGTLAFGAAASVGTSGITLAAGATLDTTAQSHTIPAGRPVTIHLDSAGDGTSGRIVAASLNITDATVILEIDNETDLDDPVYVLAEYTSLDGSEFASVTPPPTGYVLDYNYNGENKIALVAEASGNPYDEWAGENGYNLVGGPGDDDDGDGLGNFHEFAFGLDPTSGSSVNPIADTSQLKDGYFQYTRLAGSGLVYTVWISSDLEDWTDVSGTISEEAVPDENGVETVTVDLGAAPDGERFFVQVRAAPPVE